MIAILLDDNSFEQDIRELLMAFYPGESFTHEEEAAEEARMVVRGKRTGREREWLELSVEEQKVIALHGKHGLNFACIRPDFSNRFEAKNEIKRSMYGLLRNLTGKELPWGTLTGIRPTKIAMTKLDEGWDEDSVRSYMRET